MKIKFVLLSFLLLFSRGCDFYSTSLWFFQEDGMNDETNPLTRFFGVGWNGLLIVNLVIVVLIIGAYYYYCFKYKPKNYSNQIFKNHYEYTSFQYFGKADKFFQIFYKMPKNKTVAISHAGYVLVRVLIIASFLATIHNISQYYNLNYYDVFRDIVKRPLFVIYGLILFSAIWIYIYLIKKEFKAYQENIASG